MTRTEFHPAKLGAFIVGSLLLAVTAIILWGPLNSLWQKKYVMFFDETAKGLDAGATVRLNGVAIGKVDDIDLFYDQNNKVYSAVVVQLDRTKVKRISKGGQSFDDMLRNREISAQLGISGVISFKLDVELDVGPLKPGEYRAWRYTEYKQYYSDAGWIPTRESTIAKVIAKLDDVLNSEGITNLIGSIGRILDESTSNRLVFKASAAVDAVRVLATNVNEILLTNKNQIKTTISNLAQLSSSAGPRLDKTFLKLDSAADSVETNMMALGAGVDVMATNFYAMRTNLDARSAEIGVLLRGAAPLPPQAAETLRSLQDTIESLQRLIDYAERHPDSFLWGRAKEK
jgi:paraquat-inducible protein B